MTDGRVNKNDALILNDSYSKWLAVFLTTKADGAFTKLAMRRTSIREGVPLTVVTDCETYFTSSEGQHWLKSVGCLQEFTAPRVQRLSRILGYDTEERRQCIDSFLLQYRNAKPATTGENPSKPFKNGALRTNLHNVSSADVTIFKGTRQEMAHGVVTLNLVNLILTIMDLEDGSVHR